MILKNRRKVQYCPGSPIVPKIAKTQDSFECLLSIVSTWYISLHSSLLRIFGLSATSTYDSYFPLIFGIIGLIWGHFWNVRKGRFWGHGGRRGQTTLKSKTMKILNQNLLKLDEIQNLASATSKMTSEEAKWIFSKIIFLKSVHQAEKNELLLGFLLQIPVFNPLSSEAARK